jgi:uncharacterized SAM-binding protein YcdF (DUF218 family)
VLILVLLAMSLLGFARMVERLSRSPPGAADAVVIFTGEPRRIEVALQALAAGAGRRLLISGTELSAGTDTAATMAQVRRDYPAWFACCVDLDPRAQTTRENARDAAAWARHHGFASLALVTADDHLPRARLELACAGPGLRVLPYSMITGHASPAGLRREPWRVRRLAGEAVKFALVWLRVRFGPCPPPETAVPSRPG